MDLRYQSKSRLQYFSRKNKNISLVIYDQALAPEKQFKYLDIVFQENSAHTRYIFCSYKIYSRALFCSYKIYSREVFQRINILRMLKVLAAESALFGQDASG